MNQLMTTSGERVEEALRLVDLVLTTVSRGHWSLHGFNGIDRQLDIRREGDWLTFAGEDADKVSSKKLWKAVARNFNLPADLRMRLNPSRQLELRSDLSLAEDADLENRIRRVADSFRRVWSGELLLDLAGAPDLEALENLCAEAGWPSVRRASGRLTVSLDASNSQQATVTTHGEEIRLQHRLVDLEEASELSRLASVVLAMEISRSTRLVRASVDPDSNELMFEVCWPIVPTSAELNVGFQVIQETAREAVGTFDALQTEGLAGDYLSIREWPLISSTRKTKPNKKG